MKDFQKETEFNRYINAISNEDYLVVIAGRDTIGGKIGADGYANLKKLGLKMIGSKEDGSNDHWKGYVAIIYRRTLQYEMLEKRDMTVEYETTIDGIKLEICSSPFRSANRASIIVNGEEYAVNHRGMNIVVIDTQDGSVMDSVAFDTFADGRPCYRNEDARRIVFVPSKRSVMNHLQVNAVRDRLKLENIVTDFDLYKKIKVRIFQWAGSSLWSAMESLALEFARDEGYDLLVIVERSGEDGDKLIRKISSLGIKAVRRNEYSAKQDRPDIAIFNHQSLFKDSDCETVKLRYFVPITLISGYTDSADVFIKEITGIRKNYINRIFVDRFLFDQLKEDGRSDAAIELSGNPKFDLIYEKTMGNKKLPDEWRKLAGRKIILWAFDHLWYLNSCTADLYFRELIQCAVADEDMALIIRPHIDFIYEMLRHGIWTREDLDALRRFCKMSPNIVWDETIDYGYAYSAADAIMTDVNCGIIISAMPLDKPIAVLQRFDGTRCVSQYPDIIESHYNINSIDELHAFIEMVKNGEDPKREQRQEKSREYIAHFDGLNGRRIKEVIESDIRKAGMRG